MTQPPVDPHGIGSAADASPTEPVPTFAPVPAFAFAPVEPEPALGDAFTVPPARATRAAGGSSRIIPMALGAAVLVGAVGIAFAAGRATAPASDGAAGAANRQGQQGDLAPGGGGSLPDASFDLGGNGGPPGGDIDGGGDRAFPGRGFGRAGIGGLGIGGTVTAVTGDSITLETEAGMTVTVGLDGSTTYHQQAPAASSDVTTGDRVQVQLDAGFRPGQGSGGDINLGTAGDVTIVP